MVEEIIWPAVLPTLSQASSTLRRPELLQAHPRGLPKLSDSFSTFSQQAKGLASERAQISQFSDLLLDTAPGEQCSTLDHPGQGINRHQCQVSRNGTFKASWPKSSGQKHLAFGPTKDFRLPGLVGILITPYSRLGLPRLILMLDPAPALTTYLQGPNRATRAQHHPPALLTLGRTST